MGAHNAGRPVTAARHRPAPGRTSVGRVHRDRRHHGGGHRRDPGCFGSLLVGLVLLVVASFVDTHRPKV